MDRNREVRRASAAAANGLSRRRYRSGSLRDSPDEDGPVELPESGRLRDRGLKKDRDRDRDRSSRSSKRRRADRLSTREEGIDDSSEESVNGEDDDEDDDGSAGAGSVRMLSPNPSQSISTSIPNHNHNQHRKILPPSTTNKVFRAPPAWKAADEMIGVSVPRKARSASTKRSHDCWISGGVGALEDQIHRQASTSPVRQNLASTSTPTPSSAPLSPSSSNASMRKKMKQNGGKLRPPKFSSKLSSNPEELEIEIAEVLYGLMTQSQGPPSDFGKFEPNKTSGDTKSRVSSPISNSPSSAHQSASGLPHNSSSKAPLTVAAPRRKRPRQLSDDLVRRSPITSTTEMDQASKKESSSPSLEKNPSSTAENGAASQELGISPLGLQPTEPQLNHIQLDRRNLEGSAEVTTSPTKIHLEDRSSSKAELAFSEMGTHPEMKFQIDLMAPPPQMKTSPPERAAEGGHMELSSTSTAEKKNDQSLLSLKDKEDDKAIKSGKAGPVEGDEDEAGPTGKKVKAEEGDSERGIVANSVGNVADLQFDLENHETSASTANNKQQLHPPSSTSVKHIQKQPVRDDDKTAQSNSLPIPISMAGWPGGLPPIGYMAPLQGVVSMDGTAVATAPMQHLFSQPRPKRCATHCYIARNINYFQQLAKMNPFWPPPAGTASIFGAKPPPEIHRRNADKGQGLNIFPGGGPESKALVDSAQRSGSSSSSKQVLQPPNNVLPGPAFIFPITQQHSAAASVRPGSVNKSSSSSSMHPATGGTTTASVTGSGSGSASGSTLVPGPAPANGMSFNYPNMQVGNETQYLAILQNGYPFPIPTVGGGSPYRGTPHPQSMAYFNGPFYPSQMIHPSQFQQQQQQQPAVVQHQQQSNCSSSQKHSQPQPQPTQQPRPQAVPGNFISFPQSGKDRPPQQSSDAYGPVHHQSFAMMNQSDKKPILMKGSVDALPQNFAISFASMNGNTPTPAPAPALGLDISTPMPNHSVLQIPEPNRHGYQLKNFRINEDVKGDQSNNMEEDKKGLILKNGGQTIAFSRPEIAGVSGSSSSSNVPNSNAHMQAHIQFHQQNLVQLQKQQQLMIAAARTKPPAAYTSDRPTTAKFPQNLVQSGTGGSSGSPVHSPQWKTSGTGSPQVPSSLSSSNSSTIKNISQQQQQQPGRPNNQTQISFSGSSKSSMAAQAVAAPVMIGSPTTSSLSKGGNVSSSPKTTNSNPSGNKSTPQPSTLSCNQSKNPNHQKSSSTSGQSILGNPSQSSNTKTQQQQQQHLPTKQQQMMQPHLFFNPPYIHPSGAPPAASSPSAGGGSYSMQKQQRRPDQQNCSSPSTSGMLTLCPDGKPPAGISTNAKAPSTPSAGQFTSQSVGVGGGGGNPHPLIPPGFYGHSIPSPIQVVKPPEQQKQQQAGGK